jgi:glycosyltransferase involved in cell wall biosynthesis
MHIAFLTPEFPHSLTNSSGGLGTSIKNLANSLIAEGVEVTVFIYGQKHNMQLNENGIHFHFIKQKSYKFGGFYLYRKHLQYYINNVVEKSNVDLLEAPDWTGITAFMKINCPLVIRLNGSDGYFCYLEERKQKFKNYFFERKALKNADAIVSVSDFTARVTKDIFNINKDIPVIYNSLDTNKFQPLDIPVIKNQLLYFGTIIRKKGVLELAHIFNEVINQKPESSLMLIGKDVVDIFEGESTLQLFMKILSPKARLRIKHVSEVSYESIGQHIGVSEVVLLPSFAEALPMTWLEAMAMEKAMVTSNIGWASEVMCNMRTGYTENPKNHKAFAAKIINLLDDVTLASSFAKEARIEVLSTFATDIISKKNIKFYEKLLISKGE